MPHPRVDKMTNARGMGARLECGLVYLLGALSNDDDGDDDGSENITKKRNLRPFKLQRTLSRLDLESLDSSNVGDFSWS